MDKGQEAKLYYGTAGTPGANNLIGIVKVTGWSVENEAIKAKYRDSDFVNTELGTTDIPAKITLRRKPTDPGYTALKTAAYAKTPIALRFLQKIGSAEYCDGDFVVAKFTPMDEDMDTIQESTFELGLNINIRNPTLS